jgi:hypothetical protein
VFNRAGKRTEDLPSLKSSYGEAGDDEDDLEVSIFIRRPLWLCGSVVKRFLSGTAFRVLDIFDGLSGGVVADSSTPGYLLSAFQAEESARGLSVAVKTSPKSSRWAVVETSLRSSYAVAVSTLLRPGRAHSVLWGQACASSSLLPLLPSVKNPIRVYG